MESDSATDLSLEDIAILVDGTGNIPDEIADRLAPVIASDPRFTNRVEELRAMALDAGTEYLADALDAHRRFDRLQAATWEHPTDVLGHDLDVPYAELISIAVARAARAEAGETEEILDLKARLERAQAGDLSAELFSNSVVNRLLEAEEEAAEAALARLVTAYRSRRQETGEPRSEPR